MNQLTVLQSRVDLSTQLMEKERPTSSIIKEISDIKEKNKKSTSILIPQ